MIFPMTENIIDKRRKENWEITIWCTPRSVIVQITTPNANERGIDPVIDIACVDLKSAINFAKRVCHETPHLLELTANIILSWKDMSPEGFILLLKNIKRDQK